MKQQTQGHWATAFLIATALLGLHLFFYPTPSLGGAWAKLYTFIAQLSQASSISLLIFLPAIIGNLVSGPKLPRLWLSTMLTFLHLFIFVDRRVFTLYRFHINGVITKMLFTPGAARTVPITGGEVLLIGLLAILVFLLHWWIFGECLKKRRTLINRRIILATIACLLSINGIDRAVYAYADLRNETPLIEATRPIPFYQPFTIKKFVTKKLGWNVTERLDLKQSSGPSSLDYPKGEQLSPDNDRPNVIVIAIDSWRQDMLDDNVTPNIAKFAIENVIFHNHVSGGNNTRTGVFSLLYGIPGTYWQSMLSSRTPPFLLRTLGKSGYRMGAFASAGLTFPEFRHTAFSEFSEKSIYDQFPQDGAANRDIAMTAELTNFIRKQTANHQPFFAFALYDAVHSPYSYPESETIFRPATTSMYYASRDDQDSITRIINRYKNAIHHTDKLIGQVLKALEQTNQMNRTIVVITSDHGEEFYDSGYWGHFSAFSHAQTKVPLVIHAPGWEPEIRKDITSHFDIAPTILGLLGSQVDSQSYSSGVPLSHKSKRQSALSCSWDQCALLSDNGFLVFGTEPYNASVFEQYDIHYKRHHNPLDEADQRHLLETLKQMGAFLR